MNPRLASEDVQAANAVGDGPNPKEKDNTSYVLQRASTGLEEDCESAVARPAALA